MPEPPGERAGDGEAPSEIPAAERRMPGAVPETFRFDEGSIAELAAQRDGRTPAGVLRGDDPRAVRGGRRQAREL